MPFNFRLWIFEALVRLNYWDTFEDFIGNTYSSNFDFTLHKPLLTAVCETVHWSLEHVYENLSKGRKLNLVAPKVYSCSENGNRGLI